MVANSCALTEANSIELDLWEDKMAIKLVVSAKDGRTVQKEISDEKVDAMHGKKLGEKFEGDLIGFDGYEFEITGGSDFCGFPMRKDVEGTLRKKILAVSGIGLKKNNPGVRTRKTVAGNVIYEKTAQINVKITKAGSEDLFPAAEEKKAE